MQTMVRDYSFDQKETIKSFFTEDEWDSIFSAIQDFQDHGDSESVLANSIEDKIRALFRQTSKQTVTQNPYKGFFHVYNSYMNNSILNEFYPQLSQKGYNMHDLSGAMEAAISQEVPAAFKDRYSTYEEYSEAIHEFLNGL